MPTCQVEGCTRAVRRESERVPDGLLRGKLDGPVALCTGHYTSICRHFHLGETSKHQYCTRQHLHAGMKVPQRCLKFLHKLRLPDGVELRGLFAEDLETDGDASDDDSAEDLLVDKEDLGGEDTHDDMKEWLDYLASLFRAEANLCRPSLPVRRV